MDTIHTVNIPRIMTTESLEYNRDLIDSSKYFLAMSFVLCDITRQAEVLLPINRPRTIMLKFLPIMLLSSAQKVTHYAQYYGHNYFNYATVQPQSLIF